MIKVFAGNDSYESYQHAFNEVEKLAKALSTEVKIINADELESVNAFLQELEGISMFSTSNAILAKRFFQNKKLAAYIADNFDHLNTFDIIIWEDSKLDGKLKITKKLKSKGLLFDFELPKEWLFKNWVTSEAKKLKINLSTPQAEFLISRLGVNKWIVLNELEKIYNYLQAQKKTSVTEEELNLILGFDVKGDIWKFLDAVGMRDKRKALMEFEKITFYEDATQMVIAMLAREFKLISQVVYAKENSLDTKSLGINPYVLSKLPAKAAKFTFAELERFMFKLFSLDFAIKKGQIDEKLGMVLFLFSL